MTGVRTPRGGDRVARQVHGEDAPEPEVPLIVARVGDVEGEERERAALLVAVRAYREPHALAPAGHVLDGRHAYRLPSSALAHVGSKRSSRSTALKPRERFSSSISQTEK